MSVLVDKAGSYARGPARGRDPAAASAGPRGPRVEWTGGRAE